MNNHPKQTMQDNLYYNHVGWDATVQGNENYQDLLWNKHRLEVIQKKITELLHGVCTRPIVVPLQTISNVMSQVYKSNDPNVGDIYSRHIIDTEIHRNDIRDIVDRTINIIVTQIRNEYEQQKQNNQLTIWNTLYGDFNSQGLRQHPPIKLSNRRSNRMQFNMNY